MVQVVYRPQYLTLQVSVTIILYTPGFLWHTLYFRLSMTSIYIYTLLVCRPKFFCGTSHDPREGLWRIKISKIWSNKFPFPINFQTTRNSFMKSANYFVFVLQCIHRENFHNWIEEAWSAYSDLYFRMSMNTLPYNLGCLWPPTTLCLRMSMTSMPYTPGCLWPYTSHYRLSMNSILYTPLHFRLSMTSKPYTLGCQWPQ